MKIHELISKLSSYPSNTKVVVNGVGSSITDVELNEYEKTVIIY